MVQNNEITPFRYRFEKEFIKKTMKKLDKKSSQFNAAIVLYNYQATAELNFTHKFEMNHFLHAVDNLGIVSQSIASLTRIDLALQVTSNDVFAINGGSRPNTPKIAVLVTQGSFSFVLKRFPLRNASDSLMQKSVRLLVVGIDIGDDINKQKLLEITEDKGDLIMVKGFSSLPEFEDILVDKICSAIGEYKKLLKYHTDYRYYLGNVQITAILSIL